MYEAGEKSGRVLLINAQKLNELHDIIKEHYTIEYFVVNPVTLVESALDKTACYCCFFPTENAVGLQLRRFVSQENQRLHPENICTKAILIRAISHHPKDLVSASFREHSKPEKLRFARKGAPCILSFLFKPDLSQPLLKILPKLRDWFIVYVEISAKRDIR